MEGMNPTAIRDQTIAKHGAWTTLNWELAPGVFTIGPSVTMSQEVHVRCLTQLISDLGRKPIDQMRIADLASLEGVYSVEFALQGASVLGIEGRQGNIEKSLVVKRSLNLANLDFVQDDVRNLSRKKYGAFDVVVCAGILYHLDAPDVFSFIESIYEVCDGFAIIDTHIAFKNEVRTEYKGKEYWGIKYPEHSPESTMEQRERSTYASLDNVFSYWLTKESLVNALSDIGFTSVVECAWPSRPHDYADRVFLVAYKGKPVASKMFGGAKQAERYPAIPQRPYSPFQKVDLKTRVRNKLRKVFHS